MEETRCTHCPIMCGMTGVGTALTDAPCKLTQLPEGIMRITPDGPKDDVMEFCKEHFRES